MSMWNFFVLFFFLSVLLQVGEVEQRAAQPKEEECSYKEKQRSGF